MAERLRKKRTQTAPPPKTKPIQPREGEQELHDRIAEKAYQLYEKRGRMHGHDVEDWIEAERLVVGKTPKPSIEREGVGRWSRSMKKRST